MNTKEELQALYDAVKEDKSPEEQQKIMDSWSPETMEHFQKTLEQLAVDSMTASQKYDAISKALKDEKTPESEKVILQAALRELKPLILREKKIGTLGDRYPESVVAFRVFGIIVLLIGFISLGVAISDESSLAGWVGVIIVYSAISFLSSTKKKL